MPYGSIIPEVEEANSRKRVQNREQLLQELAMMLAGMNAGVNTGMPSGLSMPGRFNIPSQQETKSRIADIIRNSAAKSSAFELDPRPSEPQTVLEPKPAPDWESQLLQQLMNIATASQVPLDTEEMIADASGAINKAYGGAIGAIRGENKRARGEAAGNRKELEAMYRALARSNRRQSKQEARQGNRLANEMQNIGNQGAGMLGARASDMLNENAAIAKGLGSPDAASELNSVLGQTAQNAQNNAIGEATRAATNQRGLSGVAERYFNRSAGSARLEGTNRSADLLSSLQEYIQGNRGRIADIVGQRAQALAAAKNDILASASAAGASQQEDLFNQMMAIAELKLAMEGQEQDSLMDQLRLQQQGSQTNGLNKLFEGTNTGILGMLSQVPGYENVPDLYSQIMGSDEALMGSLQNDHGEIPLEGNTPALMQLIRQFSNEQPGGVPDQIQQLLLLMLEDAKFNSRQSGY